MDTMAVTEDLEEEAQEAVGDLVVIQQDNIRVVQVVVVL